MMGQDSKWSDEQILTIEAGYSNDDKDSPKGIIVPAAAGSGKTAVLIERTVRMLANKENNIPANTLLAVTFTNAAAAQLRDRLNTALSELIQEDPANEWLLQQQALLQMARIQTINSFCFDIVRNNVHDPKVGLQSGLRILEENHVVIIENEMFERAIDEFYEDHKDKMDILVQNICVNKKDIVLVLKKMYKYLRSIPFSDKYMKRSIAKLSDKEAVNEYCADILRPTCDMIRKLTSLNNARSKDISETVTELKKELQELLDGDNYLFGGLLDAINNKDWAKACDRIKEYEQAQEEIKNQDKKDKKRQNIKSVGSRSRKNYEGKDELWDRDNLLIGAIDRDRRILKKDSGCLGKIKNAVLYDFQNAFEECKLSAEYAEIMYEIVKNADKLIKEEKRRLNACDFADVELMTLDLLCEPDADGNPVRTELCEEMIASKEFRAILIDEFQDTNDLQDLIFKCISDTDDLDILGKNVFVVGDVKQAIYGFRRANPKLFMDARKKANTDGYKDKVLKELPLSLNFRSRKNIIDFTNFLFSRLMSEDLGEVNYIGKERLEYAGEKFNIYDSNYYPTELMLCNGNTFENVAAKIYSMINDPSVTVYEKGKHRRCRPGDFLILSRANWPAAEFADALEKFGLKISCREIKGYMRSREISLMISLLKILDNPMNNIAMLSVLLSPIFSFTDNDVAKLKITTRKSRNLYSMLRGVIWKKDDADKDLQKLCGETLEKIKRFRYYASCLPIEQLIRKLYDETDFYILAASFSYGERAQANLRLLLELAADYDSAGGSGLSGFIRYFDGVMASNKDFNQALTATSEEDAVSVMTIHSSKGLERPFVFLFDLTNEFRFEDVGKGSWGRNKGSKDPNDLIMDESGIGIMITDKNKMIKYPTCAHTAIAARKREAVMSEELRLLYVAITRARERLFITVNTEKDLSKNANDIIASAVLGTSPKLTADSLFSAKHMLSWILAACALHPVGEKLSEELDIARVQGVEAAGEECEIKVVIAEDAPEIPADPLSADDTSSERAEADDELASLIESIMSRHVETADNGLAKLSVTEIVKKSEEKPFKYPENTRLSKSGKKFSAAQSGTLTHRFMELCDFEKAQVSVVDELKRLISLGRFTEHESEGIFIEELEKFFSGEFAKKMMSSEDIIREHPFMVKFSDLKTDIREIPEVSPDSMIQGIADCLYKDGDGYVLVDYKTDRVKEPQELIDRHKMQLYLYQAALSLILDKPVKKCVIYSFCLGEAITLG